MKKALSLLTLLALMATGCNKENILPWDDPYNQNNQGNSESGSTSGVSGSTTATIEVDEEDDVAGTEFARTIIITFSSSGSATVSGDENGIVTVNGNQVTVDNTTTKEKVKYELHGSTANGFLKIYSNNKQALELNDVSITNPNGAAINNQGKKRCFVIVNGTNKLADGTSYTATPANEDEKAAFFSEGQLIFSGGGSLTVTAKGKAGITSDDYIHLMNGPTLNVNSSAGHAVRGKDAVMISGGKLNATASAAMKKGIASDSLVVFNGGVTTVTVSGGAAYDDEDKEYKAASGVKADKLFVMNDGTLTISSSGAGGKGISGDADAYFQGGTVNVTVTGNNDTKSDKSAKGVKFDGNIFISDGSVSVKVSHHEGLESKGKMEITGGIVYVQAYDDAINSAGNLTVTDGYVCAYSTNNDGMDANGNLYIEGGVTYAIGKGSPEVALDANTEKGYRLYINGGVLFAIGGLENNAVQTQKCYSASSWSAKKWYSMTVGDNTYAFYTPEKGGSGLVVSGATEPTVKSGVTVTGGTQVLNGMGVLDGSVSGGSNVSLSAYSGGGGAPGGPGGGGFPGW
jgi:hypothetical protein